MPCDTIKFADKIDRKEKTMTKRVRVENSDNGTFFKPVVQIWDKTSEGPHLAREIVLHNPTDITDDSVFLTSTRFIVIKEEGTSTPLDPVATEA